ncbi:hypothetical protein [Risungbinella massiliensis]|uniref:hypothetical protein n=1 Tax=Risungbinella massiliensis TaxID=1329796 RepID=UPI0012B61500|nr:hypothetical protein [Risungbinella massiliensis]
MTRKSIGKMIDKVLLCFLSLLAILTGYSIYSVWSFGGVNQLVKTDAAIVLGAAV